MTGQAELQVADLSDEATLVVALCNKEDEAFTYLVRHYGPRMFGAARRLLGSEDEAREALQDAFIAVYGGIHTFEARAKLSSWLHRLVVNAALAKLRKRARGSEVSLEAEMPRYDKYGFLIGPTGTTDESVEQLLQRSEVRDLVRTSIASLPEPHRSILILRDIESHSAAEAAQMLGISLSATKVRLHRARIVLKKRLEPVLRREANT